MIEPTIASDGHTYEKVAIMEWLSAKSISPITGTAIDKAILLPNHLVKSQISSFLATCRKYDES
jgi:hypothetical protein